MMILKNSYELPAIIVVFCLRIILIVFCVFGGVVWAVPGSEIHGRVVIIVHPDNPYKNISLRQLRAIYSMRMREWPNGHPVRVYVLPGNSEIHHRFCRDLLKVYPHQLQKGWDRMVYSGAGKSPVVVHDQQSLLETVAREPEAIGYYLLDSEEAPESVKVLSLSE